MPHTHTDAHTQAQPHRVTPPHTRAHMPGPLPPSDVPSALLHAQDALSHPEAMAPGHPDAATSVHLPSRGRAPTSPGSLTTAGPAREWQPRCGPERAGHEREAGLRGAGGSVGLRQASSRISPPRPPRRGAWGQGQSASGPGEVAFFVNLDELEARRSSGRSGQENWKSFKGLGPGPGSAPSRTPPAARLPDPARGRGPRTTGPRAAGSSPTKPGLLLCQILIKRILIMISGGNLAARPGRPPGPPPATGKTRMARVTLGKGQHIVLQLWESARCADISLK